MLTPGQIRLIDWHLWRATDRALEVPNIEDVKTFVHSRDHQDPTIKVLIDTLKVGQYEEAIRLINNMIKT